MAISYKNERGSLRRYDKVGDKYIFLSGSQLHTSPAYVIRGLKKGDSDFKKKSFWNCSTGELRLYFRKITAISEVLKITDDDGEKKSIACSWEMSHQGFSKTYFQLFYRFVEPNDKDNSDTTTSFKKLVAYTSNGSAKKIDGQTGIVGLDKAGTATTYKIETTIPNTENFDGKMFQIGMRCSMEKSCEDVIIKDDKKDANKAELANITKYVIEDADLDGIKNNHNIRILFQGKVESTPKITYIRWFNQKIESNAAYVLFKTSAPITSARCTNIGNGCSFYSKDDSKKEYIIKITGLAPVKAYTPSIVCSKGSGKESPAASTTVYTKGVAPSVSPGDLELHIDHIISKATAQNSKIVANTISGTAGGTFGTVQPGKIEVNKMKPNSDFAIKLTFESTLVHNPPPRDVNGNIVNIAPERKDITITGKTKEVAVITSASNFEFYDDTLFNVVYDDDKEFTVELLHRDYHNGANKCIWLHRFPNQKTASLKHVWTQDEKDEFYKQWPTNTDRENITLRITTLGKYKTESNKAWYTKEIGAVCILTGKNYTGYINTQEGNNFRRCRCWVNVTGRNDGWKPCVLWINTSNGFRRST